MDKLPQILDYHFGLDDSRQRVQTEKLLADDAEAQTVKSALERVTARLDGWGDEPVPAGLADRTLELISHRRGADKLAKASAAVVADTAKGKPSASPGRARWVFGNLRDLVAVAACLMLVFVLSRPGFRYARDISQQYQCASQMRQTGQATAQYANEHSGRLPSAKRRPGRLHWPVGRTGTPNASNTRNIYLLVKDGYLPLDVFRCPSSDRTIRIRFSSDSKTLKQLHDFPDSRAVNYSFGVVAGKNRSKWGRPGDVLMVDQNPLFIDNQQDVLDLNTASADLLRINSPNHSRRGQNILFMDGRVIFSKSRHIGQNHDDIYTIKGTSRYSGKELPELDDIFAP